MEPLEFCELINALEEPDTFIKTATNNHDFTCDQVNQILAKFAFSKEQLQVLEKLRPQISDIENLFQVIDGFTFGKEQKKANKVFGQPTNVEAVLKGKHKNGKPSQPTAMESSALVKLLEAISEHKFPKQQLYLVEVAAFRNYFTTSQVVQLLEKFHFPRYKIKALKTIRYQIIDPENHFLLLKVFVRNSEQKKVLELLKLDSTKLQDKNNLQLAKHG